MAAGVRAGSDAGRSPTRPREVLLAWLTLGFGVVSMICAFFAEAHVLGSWTGVTGLVLGTWAQMISATTAQRWIIVPGWVLSLVGTMMGIAQGGLW